MITGKKIAALTRAMQSAFLPTQATRPRNQHYLKHSYPICLDLLYRLLQGDRVVTSGTGRTTHVSSSRVLFTSERGLPAGELIELAVTWPVRLGSKVGLNLYLVGRTVGTEDNHTVVDISHYEFRTRAAESSPANVIFRCPVGPTNVQVLPAMTFLPVRER